MSAVPLGKLIRPARVAKAGKTTYPLLSMTMHEGLIDQSSKFKKRVASQDLSAYKVVSKGQLVVGFPIDEGVLDIQWQYGEGIVSPAYGVWDLVDPARVYPPYLKRFLRSGPALSYYRAKLRGTTARRRSLPAEIFLALSVPMPPKAEQQRIEMILNHADALRAKRRRVLVYLDALSQSIFHDMFGDPQCWPNRWPMGTIGDMTASVQYGTSAKAGPEGQWPMLRMGNVTDDGRLNLSDLKYVDLTGSEIPKYTTQPGDLLFNRTNSKEKVGKAAVVRTKEPLAIAGYLVRARFKPEHRSEFVSAYLRSPHGQAVRRRLAKAAVNQANINATEMRRIVIAHPPDFVQEAFVAALNEVEGLREQVDGSLTVDDELFASLQSRAFKGEL